MPADVPDFFFIGELLTLTLVLGFLAARSTGVPAREFAAVDATSDGKFWTVGDVGSSNSSWDRLREERVLLAFEAAVGPGVDREAGNDARDRDGGAGVALPVDSSPKSRLGTSLGTESRVKLVAACVRSLVTFLALCRRRSFGSSSGILPTLLWKTIFWLDCLALFLAVKLGNKGVSKTAGMS